LTSTSTGRGPSTRQRSPLRPQRLRARRSREPTSWCPWCSAPRWWAWGLGLSALRKRA